MGRIKCAYIPHAFAKMTKQNKNKHIFHFGEMPDLLDQHILQRFAVMDTAKHICAGESDRERERGLTLIAIAIN